MAKKRVDKLEESYKKFSEMNPEDLSEYREGLEEELRKIDEKIVNKEKELEGRQATIDLTTDPDKKDVLVSQKETAEDEKAELDEMRNKKTKEIKDIDNWANNKDKIANIKKYQDKLVKEGKKLKRDSRIEKRILEYNLKKEEKEINKKLEKSEELDNKEYNELIKRKEEIKREIEKAEKKIAEEEKRIMVLQGSISKCDLVWKNLMMGKSWDEIHLKAVKMNAKKVSKSDLDKDSNNSVSKDDKNNGKTDATKGNNRTTGTEDEDKTTTNNFISALDKIRGNGKKDLSNEPTQPIDYSKTKSMIEYDKFAQKHPRLAKIRDAFKNMINKFTKDKEKTTDEPDTIAQTNTGSVQRDAFVEQLRIMAEKQHRGQTRDYQEINARATEHYVERHNAKKAAKSQQQRSDDGEAR